MAQPWKPKLLQAREMQHRRVTAGCCSAGIRSALIQCARAALN
jgi:hypothetical protein